MRPEESIRDLSILVSTPTVMVAIITVEVSECRSGECAERTESDDHGSLDVVCYEGDLESSQCFEESIVETLFRIMITYRCR